MDIRKITEEEKRIYITKVNQLFNDIRNFMKTVETDMEAKELETQSTAVWICAQFCNWFSDFMKELHKIHIQKDGIQKEMMEIARESNEKIV
jgi:hypothetical protein